MNAYATTDQARIQLHNTAAIHRANRFMVGTSPVALDRQPGWQAEAEVARMLTQHGVAPHASNRPVPLLRRWIGAVLVRAGDRLLTGGLLMEIACFQRADGIVQYRNLADASETPGGGPSR
jgi:hypothetical protein